MANTSSQFFTNTLTPITNTNWYWFVAVVTAKPNKDIYDIIKIGTDGCRSNLKTLERYLKQKEVEALIVPLAALDKSFIKDFRVIVLGGYKGLRLCDLTEGEDICFNRGGSPSSWGEHMRIKNKDVLEILGSKPQNDEGFSYLRNIEKALEDKAYNWTAW